MALSASALSFQPPSPLGPFLIKQSPTPYSTVLGEEDTPPELHRELGNLLTLGLGDITHNGTAQQGWLDISRAEWERGGGKEVPCPSVSPARLQEGSSATQPRRPHSSVGSWGLEGRRSREGHSHVGWESGRSGRSRGTGSMWGPGGTVAAAG